jgi:hypothetical protein
MQDCTICWTEASALSAETGCKRISEDFMATFLFFHAPPNLKRAEY